MAEAQPAAQPQTPAPSPEPQRPAPPQVRAPQPIAPAPQAPAQPEPSPLAEGEGPFHPITSSEQLERVIGDRLRRQREQLEPRLRQTVMEEVQPQLTRLQELEDAQRTEMERLTNQVTTLTATNEQLTARTQAAERQDMIYAVLAERQDRLPVQFWPLIQGSTAEEVSGSIDALMDAARGLVPPEQPGGEPPANGTEPPAGTERPSAPSLGSPASPPANPTARPATPVDAAAVEARLEALRRGKDANLVRENIEKHIGPAQLGPQRR